MTEQTLQTGVNLPSIDEPVLELSDKRASDYGSQLAIVEKGNDAAEVFQRKRDLAKAGRAIDQRRIITQQANISQSQELQTVVATQLQSTKDTIGILNQYQEVHEQIQLEELETKVVNHYKNVDQNTQAILQKRGDAIQYDTELLEKEYVMSNIFSELATTEDHWAADLADLIEELGPADLEQWIRGFDATEEWTEFKDDMAHMPVKELRQKWKTRMEDFETSRWFDNPDRAIRFYGAVTQAGYDDAQFMDAINVVSALTTVGGGVLFKALKSIPTKVALNRAAGKSTTVPTPSQISNGTGKSLPVDAPLGTSIPVPPISIPTKPVIPPELLADAGQALSRGQVKELKSSIWHLKNQRKDIGGKSPKSKVKKELVKENELKLARLEQELANHNKAAAARAEISRLEQGGSTVQVDPLAQAVGNAIKARGQSSSIASRSGGDAALADDIVSSIANPQSSSLLTAKEQVGWALMGRMPREFMNGVAKEVAKVIEAGDRILAGTTDLAIDAVSNVLRGQALRSKVEKELAGEYKGGSIFNTTPKFNEQADQLEGFIVHIGTEEGTPFATKEVAEQWMKDVRLKGEVYQTEQGGFLVDIERNVGKELDDEIISHAKEVGFFRSIFNPIVQPSEIIDANTQLLSRAAEQSMSHVHTLFRDVWNKGIKPMSAKQRVNVEEVMQRVQRRTKAEGGPTWLSPDEFIDEFELVHGSKPTNKEVLGYLSAKQLEDASYRLLNRAVYREKLSKGYQQISYTGESEHLLDSFAGATITVDDLPRGAVIFDDLTDGLRMLDTDVPINITSEQLAKGMQGRVLIKLDDNIAVGTDGIADYAIINKSSVKIDDLSPQQVGYVGGGRIKYDYNFIVSATRSRTYNMLGGKKVELPTVALFGGKSRLETKLYAKNLDDARQIANKFSKGEVTRAEANTLLQGLKMSKFQDIEGVTNFLRRRGVELDDPIHWHADGDVPTSTGGTRAMSEGESIKAGIRNRLAKARTENRLEDVRGGYGIVSPLEAMARSAGIASRHAAFADYRAHAMTMFNNAYGKHMAKTPQSGATPIEVLESGLSETALSKLTSAEKAEINAHRGQILHTLRTKTPASRAWTTAVDDLADKFVFGKLFGKSTEKLADKISSYRNTSPTAKWKALAFQSRMGLFAMPQYLLQASMAPSIMAMSPKHGLAAMLDIAPTRMALLAKDPLMVKDLAKRLHKGRVWSRQEADDFVEFVEVFKGLGINDFGASLPELAGASTGSVAASGIDNFLDMGQVFFREGELIPRITAAGIAARKIREQGIKLSSDEGRAAMITEVNRLTFGITGADVQVFNRGMLAVGTQFWSFPMRMMTAMFGKQLTATEKASFIGSMGLLWGAGGIPFADAAIDYFQKQGMELTEEESIMAYNGLIDSMIFQATDGEIKSDFSSRQLGSFLPDLVEKLTEDGILAFAMGPTGSGLKNGFDVIARELSPIAAAKTGTLGQVTDASLGFLAANITSVDRLFRGFLAYETGVLRGRKGTKTGKITGQELLAWAGGIPLAEFNDTYTQMDHLRAGQDFSKDIALEMFNLTRRFHNDPSNSQVYKEQLSALSEIARGRGWSQETMREYAKLMKDKDFVEAQQLRYNKARVTGKEVPRVPSSK